MKTPRPTLAKTTLALLVTAGLLGSASTNAASVTWTNNTANSLLNSALWSNSATPSTGDSWIIANTTGVTLSNNFASNWVVGGITFATNAGADTIGNGTLTLTSGITNNSATNQTIGAALIVNTNVTFTNGTGSVAASYITVNGAVSGTGTITYGSTNPSSRLVVANGSWSGFSGAVIFGPIGRVNINATSVSSNADYIINATSNGVYLASAGTNTYNIGSLSGSGLIQNNGATSTNIFNVGFNNKNTTWAGNLSSNTGGLMYLTKSGAGTTSLTGTNTYVGTTTVSNGVLALGTNGTTGSIANSTNITVSGSGVFAVNRSDSVSQGVIFTSNAISGTGGFAQLGTGTTTLTATNTYTGTTTISAGALKLASGSSLASTNIVVNSTFDLTAQASGWTLGNGQTLAGSGSVTTAAGQAVTVASGATLSPGNSPGNLTVTSLILNGGANYNWQVTDANGVAGTDYDTITTGTLDLSGLSSSSKFNINLWTLSNSSATNGAAQNFNTANSYSWTLASYTNLTGTFNTNLFNINTSATNGTTGFANTFAGNFALITSNNSLVLTYAAGIAPNTWTNASGNLGSITITNGATLTFDGTGSGGTVNNVGAVTALKNVIFSSGTTVNYTLSGTAITLDAGVTNSSSKTQTLSLPLTLTAAQTFNAAGAALTVSGTIDNGGNALTLDGANQNTLSGALSGAGSLVKNGAGTATLSSSNAFSGGTVLNAGTLQVGDASALGTGTLTAASNSVLQATASATLANAVILSSGSTLTVNDNGNALNMNGPISGLGSLRKNGSGTITLGGTNSYSGTTAVSEGALVLNGSLSNTAITVTNATFTEGAGGSISGSNGLEIKDGSTVNLGGINTYTGVTTITNATLNYQSSGSFASTTNLTVNNLGKVYFTNNGTTNTLNALSSGQGGSITLNAGSAMTVSNGANVLFGVWNSPTQTNYNANQIQINGATLTVGAQGTLSAVATNIGSRIGIANGGTISVLSGGYLNPGTYSQAWGTGSGTNMVTNAFGGTISMSGAYLGNGGTGLNEVLNNGYITNGGNNFVIGQTAAIGSTNLLQNFGTGTIISAGQLIIGGAQAALNEIINSGSITTVGGNILIGNGPSTGTNMLLNNGGTIVYGGAGANAVAIGANAGATGLNQVILNGGLMSNSGTSSYFNVGSGAASSGTNQLIVSNGASFYGYHLNIGNNGSQYDLVSNNGGTMTATYNVAVGNGASNNASTFFIGNGTLVITGAGGFNIGGSGTASLSTGATNTMTVDNGGVLLSSSALGLGAYSVNSTNAFNLTGGSAALTSVTLGAVSGSYTNTNGGTTNIITATGNKNTFVFNGGNLSISGTLSATTNDSAVNSFVWGSGILSAGTITTTNTSWNNGGSIQNATLYNTNGTLWVGNITNGYAGLTTITGNYAASNTATTTFSIYGTNKPTTWTGSTSSYSQLIVSSNASLGGSIAVNVGPVSFGTTTLTLLAATNGLSYNPSSIITTNAILTNNNAYFYDSLSFLRLSTNATNLLAIVGYNQWVGTNGSWDGTTTSNWTAAVIPGAAGLTNLSAYFGTNATGSVTVDSSFTNPSIILKSGATNLTLAPGNGSLTVLTGITNQGGTNTIAAPISLGGAVSVAASGSLTLSGPISGNGSLVKTGSNGTVNIAGSNSFTGGILVTNGTLTISGSNAVGTGTLSMSNASVDASSITNSVNVGGLILSGGSTLTLQSVLNSTGSINIYGDSNTIAINGTNGSFGAISYGQTYTLASASNIVIAPDGNLYLTIPSISTNLALNSGFTTIGRTSYNFTNSGTALQLTTVGGPWDLTWTGGNATWDTNVTTWTAQQTNTNATVTFYNNDNVTFASGSQITVTNTGVLAGNVINNLGGSTNTLGGGTLTALSLTIDGNGIGGGMIISNTLSLQNGITLTGATLSLSNSNTITGTIALTNNSTVIAGASGALGTAGMTVADNSVIQAGAPSVTLPNAVALSSNAIATLDAAGNALRLNGPVSGQGGLKVTNSTGNGTVTLGGANTYSGTTVVNGATLVLATNSALSSNSALTLGSATLALGGTTNIVPSLTASNTSVITNGSGLALLTLNQGPTGNSVINGSILGPISLSVNGGTLSQSPSGSFVGNGASTFLTVNNGANVTLSGSNSLQVTNISTPAILVNAGGSISFASSNALTPRVIAYNTNANATNFATNNTRFTVLQVNGGTAYFTNNGVTNTLYGASNSVASMNGTNSTNISINENIVLNGTGNGVTNLIVSNGAGLVINTPAGNVGAPFNMSSGAIAYVGQQGYLSIGTGNSVNIGNTAGSGSTTLLVDNGGTFLSGALNLGGSATTGVNSFVVNSGGNATVFGGANIGNGSVAGTNLVNIYGTLDGSNSGNWAIGVSGTNSLNQMIIQSGGSATNIASIRVGTGSSSNNYNLLDVLSGGTLLHNGAVYLGYTTGSGNTNAIVIESGATYSNGNVIQLGNSAGKSFNTLTNNGSFTASGLNLGFGSVTNTNLVTLGGGTTTLSGSLAIGIKGTASTNIVNITGGSLTASSTVFGQGGANGSAATNLANQLTVSGQSTATLGVVTFNATGTNAAVSNNNTLSIINGGTAVVTQFVQGTSVNNNGNSNAIIIDGGILQSSATASNNFLSNNVVSALQIGSNGATINSSLTNLTIAAPVTGSGGLTVGQGTLTLASASYQGGTAVTNGAALIVNSGSLGSGPLNVNGSFTNSAFNNSTSLGPVSGTGTIDLTGSGTLTLASVTNSFSGTFNLNNGSLVVSNGVSLSSNSTLNINNGALSGTGSLGNVTVAGSSITPGGGTLTVNNLTINGGTYNWYFPTASTSNSITVNGTLDLSQLTSTFAINWMTNAQTIWDTTQAQSYTILSAGSLTGTNNLNNIKIKSLDSLIGSFGIRVDGSSLVLDYVGAVPPTFVTVDSNSSQNLAQVISNTPSLSSILYLSPTDKTPIVKAGNGELVLDGAPTSAGGIETTNFGGVLVIGSGTVTVSSTSGLAYLSSIAIGSTSSQFADSNAVLNLSAAGISNGAGILVTGSGSGTSTLVNSSGGNVTLSGPMTLDTNLVVQAPAGSSLALAGTIGGAGSLNVNGSGTLALGSANTYAGGTLLNGELVTLGNSKSLGTGTVTVLSPSTLQAGASALNIGNSVSITNGSKLSLDAAGQSSTLSGSITGQGSLGITNSTGTGTITLTASNNYAGGTTVNGGVLNVATNTALGTGSVTLNGGTLRQQVSNALVNPIAVNASSATLDLGNFALIRTANLAGSGSLSITNSGGLTIAGSNSYSGTIAVNSGNITVATNGNLGNANVVMNAAGPVVANYGVMGGVTVLNNGNSTWTTTSGSSGTANLVASNSTFLGPVLIGGPAATKFAYGSAPNMPNGGGSNYAYATFNNGVNASSLTVNGRLDLLGNGSMSLSGITGTPNGQTNWVGGGSGVIVNSNSYSAANGAGGNGNVLNFSAGGAFAGYLFATTTYATLTQSGSGTTYFGMFGQPAGNTAVYTNSQVTFAGGNWAIGQLGQNNGYQITGGNYNLNNGANVTIGGNTGAGSSAYSHGNWLINNGSMTFASGVSEKGGGAGALTDTLQLTVGSSGTLSVLNGGGIQLGVSGTSGSVSSPSSLTVNGGTVTMGGNLSLGDAINSSNAVVNDIINVTVNSGTLNVGGYTSVGYGSTAGLVQNEQATLTLNGGKFLAGNVINAPTALNSNSSITSSFIWNGGQLSAASITAANTNWNGANSSIKNNTLYNSNGTLAPGDLGTAGRTTIAGSYVQSGLNSRLSLDLAGVNKATAFTNAQINGGFYDAVNITGGGTVLFSNTTIALNPNWSGLGNGVTQLQLLTGSSSLTITNVTYAWSDGSFGSQKASPDNAIAVTLSNSGTALVANLSLNMWTNGQGNWGTGGSNAWTRGINPNGASSFAAFDSNAVATLDQNATVHAVSFLGSNNSVASINGASLTLASSDNSGVILNNSTTGSNNLGATIVLNDNLTLIGTGYLNVSGNISGTNGVTSAGTGAGNNSYVMALTGSNSYSGPTVVTSGALETTYNPNTTYSNAARTTLIAVLGGAVGWSDANLIAQAANMSNATLSFDATQLGSNYVVNTGIFTNGASSLTLGTYGSGTVILASGGDYSAVNRLTVNGGTLDLGGNTLSNSGATFNAGSVTNGTIVANSNSIVVTNLVNGSNVVTTNTYAASYTGNGTVTVAANLSGNAGFNVQGGFITLSGTNDYTGATVLTSGTLRTVQNSSTTYTASNSGTTFIATIAGPNGSWSADQLGAIAAQMTNSTLGIDGDMTLADITNAKGGITLAAYSGTASLNPARDNSGITKVSVNGGTLDLGGTALNLSGVTFIEGTLTNGSITNSGVYNANNSNAVVVSANLGGTASLNMSGTGSLTLSGVNSYSGGTVVNGGSLLVGNSSALGSGSLTVNSGTVDLSGNTVTTAGTVLGNGTISNGTLTSAVTFNGSSAGVLSAVVAGSSGISVSGPGTLSLTGSNTYSGGTVVNGGSLLVGNGSALGSGSLTVNSGTVDLNGGSVTAPNTVLGNGTISNGTLTSAVTFSGSSAGVLSAVVAGSSGISVSGPGTLSLTGSNTYSGGTVVNGGSLLVGNGSALGSGSLTVNSGTVDLNGNAVTAPNTLLGNGTISNGTLSSAVTFNGSSAGVLSAVVAGSSGISVSGPGTLSLTGSNTYSGGTVVNGGSLLVGNDNSLGNGAVSVKGGNLDLGGRSVSVPGDFTMTAGAVTNGSLTATNYNLSGGTVGSSLGEGIANITGLSSNVVRITGSLAATNVNISANGTLLTASSNALSTSASVNFSGAAGQVNTLDLGGQSLSIQSLNSTGLATARVVDSTGGSGLTLTGNSSFGGILAHSGATTIAKDAVLDLGTTGKITSSGAVNVTGGTLLLGGVNQLNPVADLNLGGKLGLGQGLVSQSISNLTLTANSVIDFSGLQGTSLAISGNFTTGGNSLSIYNWTDGDRLSLASQGSFIGDLASIKFYSGSTEDTLLNVTTGFIGNGTDIVPVPEPGVIFTGLLMVGWMLFAGRRRIESLLTRLMA